VASPLISTVLCVRDGAQFVREAVVTVLTQTVRDLELLVVDDGSTDATPLVLRSLEDPRLRVFRHETPVGPFAAANEALARARGVFIARLDADDLCEPTPFERQLAEFERRPELGLLGSACTRIDAEGRVLGQQAVPRGADVLARCAVDPPFVHSSVMWRTSLGLAYAPELLIGGDFELWSRALVHHEADNLDEPLVKYREWAGSLSALRRDAQRAMHDAVSWRFVSARWPALAGLLSEHRALRAWALRTSDAPCPPEAVRFIDALSEASGANRATLLAVSGTLGQPRVHQS